MYHLALLSLINDTRTLHVEDKYNDLIVYFSDGRSFVSSDKKHVSFAIISLNTSNCV